MGDDLVEGVGVDPFAQAQGHGFGRCGDVHAGQQLIDDFDFRADTMGFAEAVDLTGHTGEHGFGPGVSLGGTGGHHGHFPGGSFGGASGNWCIEVQQVPLCQTLSQLDRISGGNRGATDDQ